MRFFWMAGLVVGLFACRATPKPETESSLGGLGDEPDADGDGIVQSEDCDDGDPSIYTGAEEVCNGVDDDCDGEVDEGVLTLVWRDVDGDGFGNPDESGAFCAPPEGYVTNDSDCDDTHPDRFPGNVEVCDGIDNNCDSVVDEDVGEVFFADVDADGFGDRENSARFCSAPDGFTSDSADCDDTDPSVFPGATEVCNERDDNCDGSVDEGVTLTFYVDLDQDSWGDLSASTESCVVPVGYTAQPGDCDDGADFVFPGAREVCNGIDDDCDGDIDDADVDLDSSTASVWYADIDSDGFGDGTTRFQACQAPSGATADNTDCDDTNASIYPGATEVCNSVDDDCDGDIDDADSSLDVGSAQTFFADQDSDGFGDAMVSVDQCVAPTGYIVDDTDCDDTRDDIYPGAPELRDGADNDCDGSADDDVYVGTGADGSLVVTGTTDLSTDASGGRTFADAVSFDVTAISGATVTASTAIVGIAAGDEVLLINLQGTDGAYSAVGTYTFATVDAVTGSEVTLALPVSDVFGEVSNADLSGQTIVVQRVPNYEDVDIRAGARLTTTAWADGGTGVLAFRAAGTVTIAAGGIVDVDGAGYSGGATGSWNNCDSYQGESLSGLGDGDGDGVCTAYNEYYGHWANHEGGGGAHITGGGGEYGGGATPGVSWTGGSATPPEAGDVYGDAALTGLFLGSGGGGVWNGGTDAPGESPGPGGNGGGMLVIGARAFVALAADVVSSAGEATFNWAQGTWTYGAGGGAGGSVWIQADDFTAPADAVWAGGGFGESTHIRAGGDGGEGRVRIDCNTCNGYVQGTSAADAALAAVSTPAPGWSEAP